MAREIEFLAAPEPYDAEPYDAEPAAEPPRRGVPVLQWAVVVLLAIVAVATWIATRPTASLTPVAQDSQAAQHTRTVTAAPRSTPAPTPVRTMRVCLAGPPINPQLRLIATRNLPGLELLPAQSFTCTMGVGLQKKVVSESIAVRYRKLVVEIQATRRVGDSGQYLPVPAGRGLIRLASAESQSAGLNVLVEAYGRAGTPNGNGWLPLSELASDVSLQLIL